MGTRRSLIAGCNLCLFAIALFATGSPATTRTPLRVSLTYTGVPQPETSFTVVCSVTCDVDTTCTAASVLTLEAGLFATGGQSVVEFESTVGGSLVAVHEYSVQATLAGIYEATLCSFVFNDTTSAFSDCVLLNISVSADPDSAGESPLSGETSLDGTAYAIFTSDPINVQPYEFEFYTPMDPVPFDSVPNPGEPNDSAYGGPAAPLGTLTVEGRYVYWTGVDASNQPVYAPLVNATVRIWDSDSFCGDDELLGVTSTSSAGYYSIAVDNGDCTGTADVYAQALPENGHILVTDRDLSGGVVQYKFNTGVHDDAGSGILNLGTYRIEGPGFNQRACLVFDHLNRGWAGVYAAGYNVRTVRAFYGSFVSFLTDGTFYSSPAIVIGDALDANSFDVCVHEYGHAVQEWFGDNPEGNPCIGDHFFNVPNTNLCAWQEGFADFLPVAINDDAFFDFPGGGRHSMEDLPDAPYAAMSHQDALRTEGAVAGALYDLFDEHVDSVSFWEIGRDLYSTPLGSILDVLYYHPCGSFTAYWIYWGVDGYPRHLPVQAIRLNQIDFNTPPAWSTVGNAWMYPNQAYTLNVNDRVSDAQSSDAEMELAVVSNSNSLAVWEWTAPGQLRVTFAPDAEGTTQLVLQAGDGLTTTNSNTFQLVWSDTSPGKGYDPPAPCEAPCPTPGRGIIQPVVTDLGPARPNPFNPQTTFFYDLASPDEISLAIYDVRGQRIRELFNGPKRAGRYWSTWDGADDAGRHQASGVYFLVLDAGHQRFSRKLVLLK